MSPNYVHVKSNQNFKYRHIRKITLIRKLLVKFDRAKAILREKFIEFNIFSIRKKNKNKRGRM